MHSSTLAVLTTILLPSLAFGQDANGNWPQFRGVQAAGVADGRPLAQTWQTTQGSGIRWSTKIPGLAHASPVIWKDRVFVATAVDKDGVAKVKVGLYGAGDSAQDMVEHRFQLWCLDLEGGYVHWVRTALRGVPRFPRHTKASHVDSTPVTDGEHVVAIFGSNGMYCYDMEGELKWSVDLGDLDVGPHNSMDLHWGYASSPVIADGKVIVQADVKKKPFLAAFDVKTGKEIWRVARDDTTSWATPTVIGEGDDAQIIVNGCKHMGAYALKDGSEIWRMAGGGGLPIPAPLVAGDLLYLTSNHRPLVPSHPRKPIFAVKRSAIGKLPVPSRTEPGKHVAWMRERVGNYIQTPIIYRGLVYLCAANGILTILDAKTGEQYGKRHRLGGGRTGFSASPVAGDGKIYCTSEQGDVYVIKAGKEGEVLAKNSLDMICMATPAIASGFLLFRTESSVVCIDRPE